jgi:hypothetical protein
MTHSSDSDTLATKVQLAFEEASHRVIARARASNTEVVIWRDGAIVKLSPDEAEHELAVNLAKREADQSANP